MFFQDIKSREINVLFPIILFIATTISIPSSFSIKLYNMLFFIVTLIILVLYMSLKNKKFINPFQNYFGFGDVLFYLSIAPLFLLYNYIIFFIISLLFSILLQFIFHRNKKSSTIPLAGYSSLLLIFILINDLITNHTSITLIHG